ncbi:hypothetical protein GCM10010912_51390 [Paenibacillus albidus]|uniref:Uncharacterized protein n=1 Tax=Paenibacillus albidus TaxID=2041023 RepID=A0A917CXJ1_9BACL|nr:hypothetical protein [Paenibacillus albidus]GGG00227.1 hypothetical protein GCM10010912_51390 [Paenibacillus albidus]
MRGNRRAIIIITISTAFILIGIMGVVAVRSSDLFSLINHFRSFTVTVDNRSDYDLGSVETGVIRGFSNGQIIASGSKDKLGKEIKSGQKITIKPDLHLSGEGGIYLEYTDSREGSSAQRVAVCSYTEFLSGSSKVTINNDEVTVKEDCS